MKAKGRETGAGPWVHNKGKKAEKDRAVLLTAYYEMCRVFRIAKSKRLSTYDISVMTNAQIYQAGRDLYNNATIKQAQKLTKRLNLDVSTKPSFWTRIKSWLYGD